MFRSFTVIVTLITVLTGCSSRSMSNGIGVLSGVVIVGAVGYTLLETAEQTKSAEEEKQLIVEEIKEANLGRHISEVIQRIGPPQSVASDEAGGKIYIWSNEKNISVPQYSYVPVPQNNKPSEPFVPQIKSSLNSEGSETQGEMWYNPYLKKYEWRSETRSTSGNRIIDAINKGRENANSNAFASGLKSQSREKIVTGHVTKRRVESLMFFADTQGIVYNVLYKNW
ncbi:MAG: hypothetical protein OXM61_02335 [Candidatus Poribacteria bacterium]|nr:hypothetical protein [Candidatus Poribacteria bacterium]